MREQAGGRHVLYGSERARERLHAVQCGANILRATSAPLLATLLMVLLLLRPLPLPLPGVVYKLLKRHLRCGPSVSESAGAISGAGGS